MLSKHTMHKKYKILPIILILLTIAVIWTGRRNNKDIKEIVASPDVFGVSYQPDPISNKKEIIKIFKLNPTEAHATIEYSQTPKTISEWRNEITNDQIVVNGGYFLEDYLPAGFLVVNEKRIGTTLFDEDKSGLLVIQDDALTIRNLQQNPLQKNEHFDFALQSFPFLIKNSQPAIAKDSGLKARRTAIGIDQEKNIYTLAVTATEISLYEFMNELVKTQIPFTHVLNLDGGPSTGIYAQWDDQKFLADSMTAVSSIIRFEKIQ